MQILRLVTRVLDARQAGADPEIHVGQVPMLGDVKNGFRPPPQLSLPISKSILLIAE